MSKLQLVMRAEDGQIVPVGVDNPLPMTVVGGSADPSAAGPVVSGPAVADVPSGATTAQLRSALNELLASLRAAGVIADEPDSGPADKS
ncbi:hypothetical protein ACF09J_07685 [Streptomyces sp. NPDC014889]|uniref:hypothetical protein n=1 Tax=Streptomyces sp. NPDC014889 TaxID=3364928 RepID=UPI003701EC75